MKKKIEKLTTKTVLEIKPTYPFLFDQTFFKPAHFPTNDMRWQPGKRWQTMLYRGKKLGTLFENVGTIKKPKIKFSIFSAKKPSPRFLQSIKDEVIWRYNLNLDLSRFYRDIKKDRLLKPIVKRFYGLRPMHPGSLYEYLIIAIVLQNATVRRSVYMMQTLFENYGSLLWFDNQKLYCFWKPKHLTDVNEEKLRRLKMGYRAKSLIEVSCSFANKEISEMELRTKPVEEQEKTLLSLYGIGPASVGYIMFDVFHRWNYLKHISPWEQKIYSKIFFNKNWEKELIPIEKMLKHFSKWDKWKNLTIHYVWEDIFWKKRNQYIPWLEKLIRL